MMNFFINFKVRKIILFCVCLFDKIVHSQDGSNYWLYWEHLIESRSFKIQAPLLLFRGKENRRTKNDANESKKGKEVSIASSMDNQTNNDTNFNAKHEKQVSISSSSVPDFSQYNNTFHGSERITRSTATFYIPDDVDDDDDNDNQDQDLPRLSNQGLKRCKSACPDLRQLGKLTEEDSVERDELYEEFQFERSAKHFDVGFEHDDGYVEGDHTLETIWEEDEEADKATL